MGEKWRCLFTGWVKNGDVCLQACKIAEGLGFSGQVKRSQVVLKQ
jgi:hypothetical protein